MKDDTEILEIEKKKKLKLKPWVKIFSVFVIILIIGICIYNFLLSAKSFKSNVVEFEVENGQSVYLVGKKLEKEGIIRSSFAYKIYVKLHNINSYKAGIYRLDKSYNTKSIIAILSGNYYKEKGVTITFKEGKTIRGVAKEIARTTSITETEFYTKLEDEEYINSLIEEYWFLTDDIKNKDIYYPLEGYLYPNTYNFKEDVTPEVIIKAMLDQTDKVFSKYRSEISSSSYNIHQITTMASIVEQEGKNKDDRKEIAGVFYNRLKANYSLGSDVTTYYGLKVEIGERHLTSSEYNTPNAYNTRTSNMVGKLPVGPIGNFGETSLDAAINPKKTDNYFFVADKNGKVYFTKTNEEHQNIINKLKKEGNWGEL